MMMMKIVTVYMQADERFIYITWLVVRIAVKYQDWFLWQWFIIYIIYDNVFIFKYNNINSVATQR